MTDSYSLRSCLKIVLVDFRISSILKIDRCPALCYKHLYQTVSLSSMTSHSLAPPQLSFASTSSKSFNSQNFEYLSF